MLTAALALLLASNPQTMAGGLGGVTTIPQPVFRLLSVDPATECSGSALISIQGTSITHTNATTTRYCVKASTGGLASISANGPRASNNGILVEGARTNLVIRSQAFDNAAWTKVGAVDAPGADATTDPAGGSTAETLGCNGSSGGCGDADYLQSTAFVPGQATGTASVWMANANDGEIGSIIVRDTTAGVDRATCTGLELDDTGEAPNGWHHFFCNVSGMTGANNHVLRIKAWSTAAPSNADGERIWGAQFEAPTGSFGTTTIPTVAASVTRAADVYSWSNSTDISAGGCLAATVTFGQSNSFGGAILSNGTEIMMGTTDSTHVKANDGTNTVSAAVSDLSGRTVVIKVKWTGSALTVVADGTTAVGSFDGSFSSTATMYVGSLALGASSANATIDNVKVGLNPESCN